MQWVLMLWVQVEWCSFGFQDNAWGTDNLGVTSNGVGTDNTPAHQMPQALGSDANALGTDNTPTASNGAR